MDRSELVQGTSDVSGGSTSTHVTGSGDPNSQLTNATTPFTGFGHPVSAELARPTTEKDSPPPLEVVGRKEKDVIELSDDEHFKVPQPSGVGQPAADALGAPHGGFPLQGGFDQPAAADPFATLSPMPVAATFNVQAPAGAFAAQQFSQGGFDHAGQKQPPHQHPQHPSGRDDDDVSSNDDGQSSDHSRETSELPAQSSDHSRETSELPAQSSAGHPFSKRVKLNHQEVSPS